MTDSLFVGVVLFALGMGAASVFLVPQLRAMTDVARQQAAHMQHQARTIAELEQYIADHGDGDAEELGYDGKG